MKFDTKIVIFDQLYYHSRLISLTRMMARGLMYNNTTQIRSIDHNDDDDDGKILIWLLNITKRKSSFIPCILKKRRFLGLLVGLKIYFYLFFFSFGFLSKISKIFFLSPPLPLFFSIAYTRLQI